MKKTSFFIISMCLLFLVACSGNQDQDKLVQLKNRIDKMENNGHDVDFPKRLVALLNFNDKVLLDGKTDYPLNQNLLTIKNPKPHSSSKEKAKLFIDIGFNLSLNANTISIKRLQLKANKITREKFENSLNSLKKDYQKKRDGYLNKLNQYLDTLLY